MREFFYLGLIFILANLPYKGKRFIRPSWKEAIHISLWFFLCSLFFLVPALPVSYIVIDRFQVFLFLGATIVWFAVPAIVKRCGSYPKQYIDENPDRYLVRCELPAYFLKYGQVMFQQASFLYLLFVALPALRAPSNILWFVIIVSVAHLCNLFFIAKKWALIFFLLSVPMVVLFGFLLMDGYILITVSIHLLFYPFMNIFYWRPFRLSK